MEAFPLEIFGLLGSKLELKDLLALAAANTGFRKIFLTPSVNNQLANLYNYPYDLTLSQRKYENMSLKEKVELAVKTGDKRILERLVQSKGVNYNKILAYASKLGGKEIMERTMKLGANDYNKAMMYAA